MNPSLQQSLFDTGLELPQGLVYQPFFLDREAESLLIDEVQRQDLREAEYRGYTARRRIASFGEGYDEAGAPQQLGALPPFLLHLRDRVGRWTGIPAEAFVQAMVSEYRPGTPLGWHRDMPRFGVIAGLSLASACRMRFRRLGARMAARRILALELEPRSVYVLRGAARWDWQHSVSPTPALRYSITFRTLAGRSVDEGRAR